MNNHIFQIYLSQSAQPPQAILDCIRNTIQHKGGYQHRLLVNDEVRGFLQSHYTKEVVQAYDDLVPFAYKADLARLCLLYELGGWYFDATVTVHQTVPEVGPNVNCIVFKDAPNPLTAGNWNVNNGAIYAVRRGKALEIAIQSIVQNVRNRFYGRTSLDPTGPGAWGRALAIHGPDAGVITGWYHALTPMHAIRNLAYIMPNGNILAFGKRTAGTSQGLGLAAYGDEGTNSYEHLYRQRQIYAS